MKNQNCQQIEQLLVDFTDGAIDRAQSDIVRAHLDTCPHCRHTADALTESLDLAKTIWQDNLTQTDTKKHPSYIRYIAAAAAAFVLIFGLFTMWKPQTTPLPPTQPIAQDNNAMPDYLPTLAEIQIKIETEAIAARLLAKTEIIKQNPDRVPDLQNYIQDEYRYIVENYPETMTAKNITKLIN